MAALRMLLPAVAPAPPQPHHHLHRYLVLTYLIFLCLATGYCSECSEEAPCGWKAQCVNNSCTCLSNDTSLHSNKRDCVKNACNHTSDCLECNAENQCIRCVNFLDESSHTCLDSCHGVSTVSTEGPLYGNLCNESLVTPSLWIGLGSGFAAGLLLCLLVLLIVFFCRKKKQQSMNFKENLKSRHLPNEKIRKIPVFDNKGYETEEVNITDNNVMDEQVYLYKLDRMRPHQSTLEELLSQVRTRLRAMNSDDTRVPTYKGVINQLCLVLGLLTKTELNNSVPADAVGLLEWAKQMLNDYYELRQQDSSNSSEAPRAEISAVDVQPIYAVPHDSCQDAVRIAADNKPSAPPVESSSPPPPPRPNVAPSSLSTAAFAPTTADSGYYSSVSVPYYNSHHHHNHHNHHHHHHHHQQQQQQQQPQPQHNNKPSSRPPPLAYLKKAKQQMNGYHVNETADHSNNIYSCASSYSERSGKCMSTFIKDDISSVSECSERSSNSSCNSTPAVSPEGLPFNMQDATEPIEV
ncbi:uncharacterized protein LOC115223032 [Argonauta hians]